MKSKSKWLQSIYPMKTITEVYKKRVKEAELLRKMLLRKVFKAIEDLSKVISFKHIYIFGSLIRPYQFGEFSDVDIALEGLDEDKLPFVIAFLSRKIGRDVNVVPIEKVYFREKILKEGVKWKKG